MALTELEDAINTGSTVNTNLERTNMVKARRAVHLSQAEVAKKMGVTPTTYIGWEKGYHLPRLYQLKSLRDTIEFTGSDEELLQVFVVIQEPEEEPTTVNEQRRQILLSLGIMFLPGTATLAIPVTHPEESLAQCETSIASCWSLLKHADFDGIERSLKTNVPILTRYANTKSEFQKKASGLATQAMILQVNLSNRNMDYVAREQHCINAVDFARINGSPSLLSAAQFWYGDTYTYCLNQPQEAIAIFNDALVGLSSEAQLSRSAIYIDLAIAHAQDQNESRTKANAKKARDYVDLARATMPSNPELDALSPLLIDHSWLDQLEGKVNLYLAQRSRNRKSAQKAFDLFDNSIAKQPNSVGLQAQALTRRADAAILLGDMQGFETSLRSALAIIKSQHRFNDVNDVLSRLPRKWQRETAIQTLRKDIDSVNPTKPS
jgi:transcriptional regulator with XRE-family HTH domain